MAALCLFPRSGPPRRGLPGFAVFGRDTRGESGSESTKFDPESLDVCFQPCPLGVIYERFYSKKQAFSHFLEARVDILPLTNQGGQRRFSMVYFPAWPGAWGSGGRGGQGGSGRLITGGSGPPGGRGARGSPERPRGEHHHRSSPTVGTASLAPQTRAAQTTPDIPVA